MSIGECFATMPGKRLAVIGFLSDDGIKSYRSLSGLDFNLLHNERTREVLARRNITLADRERLHAALQADISDLKCQLPWANCIAIATPGLEVLTKEEVKATGLEIYSQTEMLVRYCIEHRLKHVGLFGTEWDVSREGPLAQALEQNHIDAYAPKQEHRASLSACATVALRTYPQLHGRVLEAEDYCTEVVDCMIHEACGTMDALVICNPELRALMRLFKSKRKQFFATTPIVDMTGLYWDALSRQISQSEAKTSG